MLEFKEETYKKKKKVMKSLVHSRRGSTLAHIARDTFLRGPSVLPCLGFQNKVFEQKLVLISLLNLMVLPI